MICSDKQKQGLFLSILFIIYIIFIVVVVGSLFQRMPYGIPVAS